MTKISKLNQLIQYNGCYTRKIQYNISQQTTISHKLKNRIIPHPKSPSWNGPPEGIIKQTLRQFRLKFLPEQYEISTPPHYLSYVKWQFVGSAASSVAGVLSTQSLLYAIGLGAGSVPMAAALNWIIKDGLGQLGGVLYASFINKRFDADPKRWRIVSAIALDVAGALEILTCLAPGSFLLFASIANIGKNISWLSASATRASIHQSFALKGNLADITAKAGSQTIAASILGTSIGIVVSPLVGSEVTSVLAAFAVASTIHLASVSKSLRSVHLSSLNQQRLDILLQRYLNSHGELCSLEEVGNLESVLRGQSPIQLNIKVEDVFFTTEKLSTVHEILSNEKYLIHMAGGNSDVEPCLLIERDATDADVLRGYMHASLLIKEKEKDPALSTISSLRNAYTLLDQPNGPDAKSLWLRFYSDLQASSWQATNLLIEDRPMRYWLE